VIISFPLQINVMRQSCLARFVLTVVEAHANEILRLVAGCAARQWVPPQRLKSMTVR
jgi:hypothetical protein